MEPPPTKKELRRRRIAKVMRIVRKPIRWIEWTRFGRWLKLRLPAWMRRILFPPVIDIPTIKRVFPELVAHDIVGVQPLDGPVGLPFALDSSRRKTDPERSRRRARPRISRKDAEKQDLRIVGDGAYTRRVSWDEVEKLQHNGVPFFIERAREFVKKAENEEVWEYVTFESTWCQLAGRHWYEITTGEHAGEKIVLTLS